MFKVENFPKFFEVEQLPGRAGEIRKRCQNSGFHMEAIFFGRRERSSVDRKDTHKKALPVGGHKRLNSGGWKVGN